MADVVGQTNAQIIGALSNVNLLQILGWIFFAILIIGACVYGYLVYRDRRLFNKKITAFDIVGGNVTGTFEPVIRDRAKVVKIGTGGFEILFLKKLKTWKLGFGGRVGKNTYYYFIMPDGYWYNGILSANMLMIDKMGGYVPVITTNPTMRAQYTSLEKQIDTLHSEKKGFWDKYGMWVLGIGFVLIAGMMLWLNYREFASAMASLSSFNNQQVELLKQVNNLIAQVRTTGGSGLVPA